MKIKELIKKLKDCDPNATILISSDEELNTLFGGVGLCKYLDYDLETDKEIDNNEYALFGYSGSEKEYL